MIKESNLKQGKIIMQNQTHLMLMITTEDIIELFELVKNRKPTEAELISVINKVGDMNEKFKVQEYAKNILRYIRVQILLLPDYK